MDDSANTATEGKETKATITFNKVATLTEELRICRDIAKSIRVKLYGHSPENKEAQSEVAQKNPVFFDHLFDDLLTLKNIVGGIKATLNEISGNL